MPANWLVYFSRFWWSCISIASHDVDFFRKCWASFSPIHGYL